MITSRQRGHIPEQSAITESRVEPGFHVKIGVAAVIAAAHKVYTTMSYELRQLCGLTTADIFADQMAKQSGIDAALLAQRGTPAIELEQYCERVVDDFKDKLPSMMTMVRFGLAVCLRPIGSVLVGEGSVEINDVDDVVLHEFLSQHPALLGEIQREIQDDEHANSLMVVTKISNALHEGKRPKLTVS